MEGLIQGMGKATMAQRRQRPSLLEYSNTFDNVAAEWPRGQGLGVRRAWWSVLPTFFSNIAVFDGKIIQKNQTKFLKALLHRLYR